ncbi:MAG: GAF domain-containing protein [Candidatus Latescibacteria bacterium]|nr:GAF domain-containing protein [Candidatus Latescibacterota bacterium]
MNGWDSLLELFEATLSKGRRAGESDDEEGMQLVAREIALLSRQAAQVAEHIDFYQKFRRRLSRSRMLARISEAAHASLQLPEVLDRIVRATKELMEARVCAIHLVEEDEITFGAAVGYSDPALCELGIERSAPVERAIRAQRSYRIADLWAEPELPPETFRMVRAEKLRSFLGAPVISLGNTVQQKGVSLGNTGPKKGGALGNTGPKKGGAFGNTLAILSVYGAEPDQFSSDEEELLGTVARQTAHAIRNAQRYAAVETQSQKWEQQLQARTEEVEAARKQSNAQLEELGNIRDELSDAKKMAAVGKLAAGLAHEINNPLGIIKNYLRLISDEVDQEGPVQEFLDVVDNEIGRVARTVRELLDLSRPVERRLEPANLNEVVEELVAITQRSLLEKKIEVLTELEEALPPVLASQDGLKRVFLNLIKNAEHAMPEVGTLAIKTKMNGKGIQAIFSDTGQGIPPEDLAHIFDPFFSTKLEGDGLGLAVSHQMMERFGGKILVESAPGEGATFTVWFPLRPIQLSLKGTQE